MPAFLKWYDAAESILQVTFDGRWTMEELVDLVGKAQKLIEPKAPDAVSIILNLETSAGLPRGVTALPHLRHAIARVNYKYLVIAGGTSFGLKLTRIVVQLLPERSRSIFFERDVAAAEARIESLRVLTR